MNKGQPFAIDVVIAAADTPQQLDLSAKLTNVTTATQLILEADSGNSSVIKVGDGDVTPTGPGKALAAGADLTLVNIHWPSLYIVSATTDDILHVSGVL